MQRLPKLSEVRILQALQSIRIQSLLLNLIFYSMLFQVNYEV